jgi:hypothetical protein
VAVSGGVYNVQLGAVEPLGNKIFYDGIAWLEVAIYNTATEDWETMSPRQAVTSVAYAIKAGDTDTLDGRTAADLDDRYVREGQANSVTSAMIQDNSLSADDLAAHSVGADEITVNAVGSSEIAANAVTESEIDFPLDYSGYKPSGGIVTMTNTSDGSSYNFPAGLCGISSGSAGSERTFGILGTTPSFSNSATLLIPKAAIGVAGASLYGHGVVGTSASHHHAAVYAKNTRGYGVYATHTDASYTAPAVYAINDGSGDGVLALASDSNNAGIHGKGNSGALAGKFDGDVLIRSSAGSTDTAKFDVSDYSLHLYNAAGTMTIELDSDYYGDGRIITQELQITGGSDLSEQFDIEDILGKVKPGMVVSIDAKRPGKLKISGCAYDSKVAGIISGAGGIKPGMMMGQRGTKADGAHPVALTGRVYCWAETSTGHIQPGDLLTTSDIPGHAMKVTEHNRAFGTIIGKAMTSLEAEKGLVLVLVSLQ